MIIMLKMFKNLKKKEIIYFVLSIAFIVAGVLLDLKIPDYMQEITTLLTAGKTEMKEILVQGGFMLACAFGSLICAVVVGFCASFIGTSFEKNLRSNGRNQKVFDEQSRDEVYQRRHSGKDVHRHGHTDVD